ncbi:MAG: Bax inhibitor-1/YccA family protein [Bifidobacteriaceae bacterium]|jgi:uncharacterized YccA/Bax inhibitor family protein|nr:Bax inhibitor-1/YccA family protein [Bifidobacteriaceae bacterium]
MSNPVFNRSPDFSIRRTPPGTPITYGHGSYPGMQGSTYYGDPAQLNAMYAGPAAGPVDTGRVTYDDVLIKSVSMFAVVLVGAALGWAIASVQPAIIYLGGLVGFVLALINIFKREPSPVLITCYAVFEGLFVGGLSVFFETAWPGIVMQAVIASLAVFGVTLALFASGKVRSSTRMNRIFLAAMLGYLVFSLINFVLMVTGLNTDAWGMRSVEVLGIPLGVILGIFVVFLAAYSFVLDFDRIKYAVENGAPRKIAWTSAFGLLLTLIWLYLEILRMLAISRSR